MKLLSNLNFDHVRLYDVDLLHVLANRGTYRSSAGLFLHYKDFGKKNKRIIQCVQTSIGHCQNHLQSLGWLGREMSLWRFIRTRNHACTPNGSTTALNLLRTRLGKAFLLCDFTHISRYKNRLKRHTSLSQTLTTHEFKKHHGVHKLTHTGWGQAVSTT